MGKKARWDLDEYGAWNQEQRGIGRNMGGWLTDNWNQPAPQYPGQFAAGLTPEQQTQISRSGRLGALSEEGFGNLLSGKFPEKDFQTGFVEPSWREFDKYQKPLIEEQYADPGGGGYWRGARADAVMGGAGDVASDLSSKRAQLNLAAKEWPGKYAPGIAQYQEAQARIQEIPRMIEQMGLDKQYNEWVRTRPESLPYLQLALDFLNIGSGTARYQPFQQNAWGSVLQGAGQGLMMGSAMSGGGKTPQSSN